MNTWAQPFLPFFAVLGRVSAFMMVLPVFSWRTVPMRLRAMLALLMTIFVAMVLPAARVVTGPTDGMGMSLLVISEALTGLSLGLSVRLVFAAVEVGGRIASQQMGLAMAGTYDPSTGEESMALGTIFEMLFVLFFLAALGHHLLIRTIFRSYELFPAGQMPTFSAMAEALVEAGSAMMVFGIKIAAPVLAAFLCLSVFLAILARVLPEMNILFLSLPLRVALGLFMASAMVPSLNYFTEELAVWLQSFLAS